MIVDRATLVFRSLREAMYGACLNAHVPEEHVDDVLQDCFLRIWAGLHSYESETGELGPWMMGCLRHAIGDWRRSEARLTGKNDRAMARFGSTQAKHSAYYAQLKDSVEDRILGRIDRERLADAVDAALALYVTERQEHIIRRHFADEKPWHEVAEEDGVSKNSVVQAWLYGRERLRKTIEAMIDPARPMPRAANGRTTA